MSAQPLFQKISQPTVLDLTPQQRDFWEDYAEQSTVPSMNVGALVTLPTAIDMSLFIQAYQHALRANDALQLVLVRGQEGKLLGQIPHQMVPMMEMVDFQETANPDAAAFEDACRLADAPLNPFRGPLYRARLYRLGPERWAWAFVCHHIVCDGWSMGMFMNDVVGTYRGLLDCRVSLPEKPSFTQWVGEGGPKSPKRSEEYWRRRLPETVNRLFASRKEMEKSPRGLFQQQWCSDLQDLVETFEAETKTPVGRLLQAVLGTVLSHRSGRRDWVMGVPSSNRRNRKQKKMSGQFASGGVFPWCYATEHSLTSLLTEMGRDLMGDYRAGACALSKLAPASELENQDPVYDVSFNILPAGDFDYRFEGGQAQIAYLPFQHFAHGLEVVFLDAPLGAGRGLVYNFDPAVLSEEEVAAIHHDLLNLLERAVAEPERALAALCEV